MSHPDPLHDPENVLPEDPDLTDIVDLSEIPARIEPTNNGEDAVIRVPHINGYSGPMTK